MVHLDTQGYLKLNQIARESGWAHGFLSAYALWGGLVALVVLLVVGWLLARRRPDAPARFTTAFLTGVGAVVALGANHFISDAVGRARPFVAHPDALVVLHHSRDFSFPSDHCMVAGALALGLTLLDRRLGVLAWLLALLLAFSRVYVGVHYPGDVIGGLLIGAAIFAIIWLVAHRPLTALAGRLARTPLRPLVAAS